jgi:hypothetical protein
MPTSKQQWISLADELMKWALLPETKDIKEFAISKKISYQRLSKWAEAKKEEYFSEIWDQVLIMLDYKRDKPLLNQSEPMLNKDYWNYIKFMKPFYDKQVREYELEKKQIAQDSAPKAPVVINKYIFAENKEEKNVVEEEKGG